MDQSQVHITDEDLNAFRFAIMTAEPSYTTSTIAKILSRLDDAEAKVRSMERERATLAAAIRSETARIKELLSSV
jgi:uncharacterized protein YydD (DUF2326 family)